MQPHEYTNHVRNNAGNWIKTTKKALVDLVSGEGSYHLSPETIDYVGKAVLALGEAERANKPVTAPEPTPKKIKKEKAPEAIKFTDVMSVYSGKAGHCCCGCSGKHTYRSETREQAGKNRGYAIGDDEVNDSSVKRILSTMNQLIASNKPCEIDMPADWGHIAITFGSRLYVAYLRK